MFAVFVDNVLDSIYDSKEEAKIISKYFRVFVGQHAKIKRLTKKDKCFLGIVD